MRRQRASGIALVELILVVAIALVLVAIAWPAWQRSVRRGRTVEAVLNVRRLYDAAATYYHTAHFDKNGVPIPRQFPQTASWTPNGPGVCCATLAQVCDPATYAKQWGTTTWQALHFSMDEPFHYSYQFDSAGVDAAANFTAPRLRGPQLRRKALLPVLPHRRGAGRPARRQPQRTDHLGQRGMSARRALLAALVVGWAPPACERDPLLAAMPEDGGGDPSVDAAVDAAPVAPGDLAPAHLDHLVMPEALRIDRVLPASGPAVGGTTIAIEGAGFQAGLTITIDGAMASGVTFLDAAHASAVTPPHAPARVMLALRNPDGREATARFHYLREPAEPLLANRAFDVAPGLLPLQSGDVDGDGKADLVTASAGWSTLHVLPGRGDGTFLPASETPTCSVPSALVLGDFDADAKVDIAVACRQSGSVRVHSAGRGLPPTCRGRVGGGHRGPRSRRDGALDLAVADEAGGQIVVLLGTGVVRVQGRRPAPRDGRAVRHRHRRRERRHARRHRVRRRLQRRGDRLDGRRQRRLRPGRALPGARGRRRCVAGAALRPGAGRLRRRQAARRGVIVGAPFRDGWSVMLLRQAEKNQAPIVKRATGDDLRPTSLVALDFDRDGRPGSLAVADAARDRISFLRGNGKGGLNPWSWARERRRAPAAVTGDWNSDGMVDLAHANFLGGDVVVLQGTKDGLETPPRVAWGWEAGLVGLADLDEDGVGDLLVGSALDERLTILLAAAAPASRIR